MAKQVYVTFEPVLIDMPAGADNFADDRYSRLVLIHAAIKKLKHELENSNVVLDHLTHVVKA
jgi:hypothetical protein